MTDAEKVKHWVGMYESACKLLRETRQKAADDEKAYRDKVRQYEKALEEAKSLLHQERMKVNRIASIVRE